MARKRIGELLLERGVITREQLEGGLSHHRATRQRLGVSLIQKGFVTEEQLSQVLSEALGIAPVELRGLTPDWSAVHMLRARFCESNDLFPYALEASKGRKQLLVAMSDPLNLPAIEEIEFTTGLKVLPRIAPLSAIRAAILRAYHKVQIDETPSGKMTLIQRGGGAREVDMSGQEAAPVAEDEVIIEGEELTPVPEVTQRTALAELMRAREKKQQARRVQKKQAGGAPPSTAAQALSEDLDYLFGTQDGDAGVEALERKFWALMRVMARKGLLTKEEFLAELADGDEEG